MSTYRKRVFTVGRYEAVSAWVRVENFNDTGYRVTLREDPDCVFTSGLALHFERIATLCYVELLMKGAKCALEDVQFVLERPGRQRGPISRPGQQFSVHLQVGKAGYESSLFQPIEG